MKIIHSVKKNSILRMMLTISFYVFNYVFDYFNYIIYKHILRFTFKFDGGLYPYFYHRYNTTWKNERAIEIPIIQTIAKNTPSENILEVGNVLSHYFNVKHTVVDKYECGKGVINQDIIDFKNPKKYDYIISISTLEHVGWDEYPKDSHKILKTINRLKCMLSQTGKIIITVPIGYSPYLDDMLNRNQIKFHECYCFKRISKNNKWMKVRWDDIQNARYGYPFECANGILIGILKK